MMAELTDIEKKIIRQVEYYFGDINLPRDRFLQDQIKQDDGWVTVETMTKFNRLKQITEDSKAIAEALKKSTSGLLEVKEDNTKIRRSPDKPIPENTEERRQDVSARTIYAKGFPLDVTIDDLEAWFGTHGAMETVFMRKDEKKLFKGSVFATFKSKDDVDKFMAAESMKYKDTELEARKSKSDYYKDKAEEKKNKREERQNKGKQAHARQEEDQKSKIKNDLIKGCLLNMKNLNTETKIEDIKNFLSDHGQMAWVEYPKNATEAFVRYDEENLAVKVLEKVKEAMPDGIILNGNKLECRVLEGEEESDKWVAMYQEMIERRNASKKFKQEKRNPKNRWGKRPSKRTRDARKAEAEASKDASEDEGEDEPAKESPEKKSKPEKTPSAGGDDDAPAEKKPKIEEPAVKTEEKIAKTEKREVPEGDSEAPPTKKPKPDEAQVAANGD